MPKKIYIAGIAVYLILLWFSVTFYKERTAFADSAFFMFEMVRKGDFVIGHYRFIAVVIEVLPVLCRKLSLPLGTVMKAYSVNIVLFHLACYLTCGIMKNYRLATGLLLLLVLFTTHAFYWAMPEMIQALVLLFPFLAILSRYLQTQSKWLLAILVLLIPVLSFAHPLIIFPFAYALVFIWLDAEKTYTKPLAITGGLFITSLVVKAIFFTENYDTGSMGNIRNFFWLFPDYINLYSNRRFFEYCLTYYYWIPLSSILIITVYIVLRAWPKLLLYATGTVGYLLLINVSYPGPRVQDFYKENLYTPVGIFIALPLVYDVLPAMAKRSRVLVYTLVSAIAITGLLRIYTAHKPYIARVNWLHNYAVANEGRKIMAHERHVPMDTLQISWATPYEFWLVSTLERNRTTSILVTDKLKEVSQNASLTYSFVTPWGSYSYDLLDKRYFKFADSFVSYQVLP